MADDNVKIGIEIDTDQAQNELDKLYEKQHKIIEEMKGVEKDSDSYNELADKLEVTNQHIGAFKANMDRANQSVKNNSYEIGTATDATKAITDATKLFSNSETELGKTIGGVSNTVGASVQVFQNLVKQLKSAKTSTNGLEGGFKSLNKTMKVNIIIAIVTALIALYNVISNVVTKFRDLREANNDLQLESLNQKIQRTNDLYSKQAKILQGMGASQSKITEATIKGLAKQREGLEQYINQLAKLVNNDNANLKLGLDTDWTNIDLNEYNKLNDKSKEYVQKLIEGVEQWKAITDEMYIAQEYTLELQQAEEEYNSTLSKIENNYKKIETKRNSLLLKAQEEVKYYESIQDYSDKRFLKEQEIYNLSIKELDDKNARIQEEIDENNKLINSYNVLINKAEKTGDISNQNLLYEKNKSLEIKNQTLQIDIQNNKNQKNLIQLRQELAIRIKLYEAMKLYDELSTTSAMKFASSLKNYTNDVNKVNEITKQTLGGLNEEFDGFLNSLTDISSRLDKVGISAIKNIPDDIENATKAIKDFISNGSELFYDGRKVLYDELDTKDKAYFTDLFTSLNNAWGEYYQIQDKNLNNVNELFNNVSESFQKLIETNLRSFEMRGEFKNFNEDFVQLITEYQSVYDYITGSSNVLDDSLSGVANTFMNLSNEGVIALENLITNLRTYYGEFARTLTEIKVQTEANKLNYIQSMKDTGIFNLREEIAQYDSLLQAQRDQQKANMSYHVMEMEENGVAQLEIERWVAEESTRINNEYWQKKRQMSLNYFNLYTSEANNAVQNLTSIFSDLFEGNKKVEGSMLIASTISNAAQTFGSVYAQAAGGAGAKAVQATLASGAVIASGIKAYRQLMATTEETNSINGIGVSSVNVGNSAVTNTLVSRNIKQSNEDKTEYVVVVDEVTAKQRQQSNTKRVATI